ncbi:MAG: hypothetical protein ACPGVP_20560 [Thiolinea sp.]
MSFNTSNADLVFKSQMEACTFPAADFDHRGHLRLAYIYLCGHSTDEATTLMRDTLLRFLTHNGVDQSKYHETITHAWILAVHHFMHKTGATDSSDELIDRNPVMLDSKIMLKHYSAALLFSDVARVAFVQPDIDPIPEYAA